MSEDEALVRSDVNHWRAFRMLAAAARAGDVRDARGLLIAATGIAHPGLNRAYVTRPLSDPGSRIGEAISYFDGWKLPFTVRLREGVDPASEQTTEAHGLSQTSTLPVMVLAPLRANQEVTAGLEIREVADCQMLSQHLDVVAAGFGWPEGLAQRFALRELLHCTDAQFFLGYVDGRPVAAAQLIVTDGTAGVYYVATLGPFRRRGLGTSMTWHALRAGLATGCRFASLQASDIGRGIYERMGFRTVSSYRTFARPYPSEHQEVVPC